MRKETVIILLFILVYTIAATLVSLHRFWQVNAFWYDFGIFEETVWKLSRLQLPIITNLDPPLGKIVWADHFNPSIVFITPIYWFSQKPEAVLIAQAVSVGLSAVVAYLLARKLVADGLVRITLIVSYLGFVGLQNALYTDVHNIVFALLPFMLAVWATYNKEYVWYWIFFLITLGFQESMAGVGVGLGLFLLLANKKWRKIGIFTIVISFIWGLAATKIVIPHLGGSGYHYQPDFPPSVDGWLLGLFSPPELKLKTIIVSCASFGFLPLFSLPVLPLLLEHFLERFVLNQAATRWDLGFHYNALLSAILFLGAADAIRRMKRKILTLWAVGTIAIVFVLHRFILHGPLLLATHPAFYRQTRDMRFLRDFINQIPREGLLMTQNNLATYFTHGKVMLLNLNFEKIAPDYVAVDIRAGQNPNNFFPLSEGQFKDLIASLSANQNYQKKVIREDQWLFVHKSKFP